MTEFTAEVTDIREESRVGGRQRWRMLLDRTRFSAVTDTGTLEAIARSGARLTVSVLGVVVDRDEVWHVVDKPLAAETLVVGHVSDCDGKDG